MSDNDQQVPQSNDTGPSTDPHANNERAFVLLDQIERRRKQSPTPLTVADLRAIADVADSWSGPTLSLTHWHLCLRLLSSAQTDDPDEARRLLRLIANHLLQRPEYVHGQAGRATIPPLALLVHAAARHDAHVVARQALRAYRERINRFFAQAASEFLNSKPDQSLWPAAITAFERGDIELAVLCSEAGRLKFLTAIIGLVPASQADAVIAGDAASAIQDVSPGDPADEVTRFETTNGDAANAADLLFRDRGSHQIIQHLDSALVQHELGYDEINTLIRTLGAMQLTATWIVPYILPWQPVSLFASDVPGASRPPATSRWLLEPNLDTIAAAVTDSRVLLYLYTTRSWTGVVFIGGDTISSFKVDQDYLDEVKKHSPDDHLDNDWLAGLVTAKELTDHIRGRVPLISSPIGISERRLQQFVRGFSKASHIFPTEGDNLRAESLSSDAEPISRVIPPLVIPSARLLQRPTAIDDLGIVAYIGDAHTNLAGPWLEAPHWQSLTSGDPREPRLGDEATIGALRELLATADLLVLGIHCRTTDRFGPVLELSDGTVDFYDLVQASPTVPRQVVLASCAAGGTADGAPADESLGLASALLAAGARRVLAPLTPVDDLSAAVLSIMLTRRLAIDPDLRRSWPAVGNALRASTPTQPIRDVIGDLASCPDEFPYPRVTVRRALARSTSTLLRTHDQYTVFGT